jgi:hypothetical protein
MNDKDKKCEWRLSRKKGKITAGTPQSYFYLCTDRGKRVAAILSRVRRASESLSGRCMRRERKYKVSDGIAASRRQAIYILYVRRNGRKSE